MENVGMETKKCLLVYIIFTYISREITKLYMNLIVLKNISTFHKTILEWYMMWEEMLIKYRVII
jgi:hypothetical protein